VDSHIVELTARAFAPGLVRDQWVRLARFHDLCVAAQDWHAVRLVGVALRPHMNGWVPTLVEVQAAIRAMAVLAARDVYEPDRAP